MRLLILHETWRNLARDEKVSTGECSHELVILQLGTKNLIVFVEASGIKMLVSCIESSLNGAPGQLFLVISEMIAPEANLWDISSIVETQFFRKQFTNA